MTNAPDFGDVLAGALRDIWPAMRSWGGWAIAATVVASAAGIWVVRLSPPLGQRLPAQDALGFMVGIFVAVVVIIIAEYFALASAVRTVKPEFRMTVGTFFGNIGYSLVVGLIVMFGCILLVIPGLYAMVRLGLAPYLYLLGEGGGNPLWEARVVTRGRFWLTAAVFVVLTMVAEAVGYASGVSAEILAVLSPGTLFVMIPLGVAALLAATQFQFNVYLRWAYALKTSSTLSNTGTAVPPTVTP